MVFFGDKIRAPDSCLWLAICALLLACPAYATQADANTEIAHAQKLLSAGDYGAAYREYLQFAEEKQNPLAQFTVALFHDYGWGRAVNHAMACQWYAKAAVGHIPAAQHFYAECLQQGINGPADPGKAAHWYKQAVQNGHTISLCSLAQLHITGQGVPQAPRKGLALCQQAAEQGLDRAMVKMGQFHLDDNRQLRDYEKAYYWFKQASQTANAKAQYYLGIMYRDGLGRDIDLTAARNWFESAASHGFVPAYYQTGLLYFNAPLNPVAQKLHPNHLAKAYLWLSAAAERTQQQAERQETTKLLGKIKDRMPAAWLPSLNEKLAQHLELNNPEQ